MYKYVLGFMCLCLPGIALAGNSILEKNFSGDSTPRYKSGELILEFREGVTEQEIEAFYDEYYGAYGIKKQEDLDRLRDRTGKKRGRGRKLAKASNGSMNELMPLLAADARVQYVEPNYIYSAQEIPDDPGFPDMWGLHNIGQTGGTVDVDIDYPEARDVPLGSGEVLVAVIDSGIDYTHEDLVGNLWVNPNEIPGNGVDDDGNGYIDDIHGINAITDSGDPFDDNGHGTHVAGTLGAVSNNGIGVSGVSRQVKIVACKFLDNFGNGTTANASKCVQYVNHLKQVQGQDIRLANHSWGGGGFSQVLQDGLAGLDQPGMPPILHVAAAGNFNRNNDEIPFYPGSYDLDNIVAVAATDHNDTYASFSNFGFESVDLAAPGVGILSTVPTGVCQWCNPTGYGLLSGTSMASPHVAGVAAELWAKAPTFTVLEVRQILLNSVDLLGDISKRTATDGRVNGLQALTTDVVAIPPTIISAPVTVATVGQPYTYQPQASGGGTVNWLLVSGPGGMTIDTSTGLVSWNPVNVGSHTVEIHATNSAGTDTQTYVLLAADGTGPPPSSTLVLQVTEGWDGKRSATLSSRGDLAMGQQSDDSHLQVDKSSFTSFEFGQNLSQETLISR